MRRRLASRLPAVQRGEAPPAGFLARVGSCVPARLRRDLHPAAAGRKVVFAAVGAGAGALASFPSMLIASPFLAVCLWRLPDALASRRADARVEEVRAALPDALDLLAVCALAGMGIDPALRLVAPLTDGPLGEGLRAALQALDVGMPRDRAYSELARVARADDVARVVRALERAERYGSSVALALQSQAVELRARRRSEVQERAMGAPVRMLFPLALCFLPAFVLLTIAPAVITAARTFGGFQAGAP